MKTSTLNRITPPLPKAGAIYRLAISVVAVCLLTGKFCTGQDLPSYDPNWESLQKYQIPDWMADAKFGIFVHWGPSCVSEHKTDWYPRWMYEDAVQRHHVTGEIKVHQPHPAYLYHVQTYGDPSEVGYKDLIPMFKAENFDAKEWVDLFVEAGAKYVIPVAEHHDGYAMYDSSHTRWNSVEIGPKRDLLAELRDEIRRQGLIFGASSHYAFNWRYYPQDPAYDTGNPQFSDLYAPQHKQGEPANKEFLEMWWVRTKEIIDNYQPDILWFDFGLDSPEFAPYHPKLAAYYYNHGRKRGVTTVLQTKNLRFPSYPKGTHMLDLERSKSDEMLDELWQTDTSVGSNSWFYCDDWESKSANSLIDDLVDIVSKNGCLLLNIGPDSSGRIPDEQADVLREIGRWLKVNGEAIYGTRPWKVFGEGPTKVATGHLSEGKNREFTSDDIRFTAKSGTIYATLLQAPQGEVRIQSLNANEHPRLKQIDSIAVLGSDQTLKWRLSDEGLTIESVVDPPFDHAVVLKINVLD
ncbi:alpha-L-fucosidase [Crateriforma conspicua]|uniref:alpha-L-fucosidase n=1 Tax=Crateriforma conspicua TaxID=2527996 RepID=A0A5C5XYT0_9PLAN|nr:alpha-L-fucosidase [Crateriforma conspicua]TWT67868.1 Alpha-L-fucosidase [Crateriforma conspicua]